MTNDIGPHTQLGAPHKLKEYEDEFIAEFNRLVGPVDIRLKMMLAWAAHRLK